MRKIDVLGGGYARRLPNSLRLNRFHDFVTKEFVRFKRHELRILDARVLKLSPLIDNARHARQRTAHPLAPFQTPHHNAVTIVVELTRCTELERTEERNRKRTLVNDAQTFFAVRQLRRSAQRGHHDVVRR